MYQVLVLKTLILWEDEFWQHALHFCTVTDLEMMDIFSLWAAAGDIHLGHAAPACFETHLEAAVKFYRAILDCFFPLNC